MVFGREIWVEKNYFVFIIFFVILFFLSAFRPISIDRDSIPYTQAINAFVSGGWSSADFHRFEPTFYGIIWISKFFFENIARGVFIIYALLSLIIKFYAIRKYFGNSGVAFIALYVFVCLFFLLHDFTQMRASVAIGIYLISLGDIAERKPINFYVKCFFAILFHYSSIIMLPLYFLNVKKVSNVIYFLPLIGIVLSFIIKEAVLVKVFSILPYVFGAKATSYLSSSKSQTNIIILLFNSKVFFFYAFILYMQYAIWQILRSTNDNALIDGMHIIAIKTTSIALFIYFLFIQYRVLAYRPSEFLLVSLIILVPKLIESLNQVDKKIKYIVIILVLMGCAAIFIVDQLMIKKLLQSVHLKDYF